MAKINLNEKHKCPVCGKFEFERRLSQEICEICGWQDDILDENDQTEDTGANEFGLEEYRKKYEAGWRPEWVDESEG